MKILAMHGPNLNMLGVREPERYGKTTLAEIDQQLRSAGEGLGVELSTFQSNHEGALVDYLQEHYRVLSGILINPGGLTHTSVVLRDALLGTGLPFVEVHLTNVHAREPFRRHSYLSDVAVGVIAGFGVDSYVLGLHGLVARLRR